MKPKFLYTHVLPLTHTELTELLKAAQIGFKYVTSRAEILRMTKLNPLAIPKMEIKLKDYLEKVK